LVALHPDKVAKQVEELRKDFMKEHVPENASGQVQRVAMRFALVAAGGNLATSMGITGWPEGEPINAAVCCFKDWLAAWGGVGNKEVETALSQVRHFLELHGESRFTAWDGNGERPTINRAGFRRVNEAGETEFYVLPEAFKSDLCAGLDPSFVAKLLIKRGLLIPDQKDGKSASRHRLPGMGVKRCYYFPAKENE
jgi:putative DNA primase/helicase